MSQTFKFVVQRFLQYVVASRRPGSFPGTVDGPTVGDTSTLGVNMAEYVLGSSPLGKDIIHHRYVSTPTAIVFNLLIIRIYAFIFIIV